MLDALQEPPPPKPVRPGRRIVRSGVAVGVFAFVVTAVGAVMLGQGPGPLEIPGGVIHRIGMVGMLGGFVIVLLGYRWPQLRAFAMTFSDIAASEVPAAHRQDIHRLLDQVGPDMVSTIAATVPVEVVTSDAPTPLSSRSPASEIKPSNARLQADDSPPWNIPPPTATAPNQRRYVAAPVRGSQVGPTNVPLLIVGWALIGLVTFFGLAIYFLAARGVAFLVAGVAELALTTALLVTSVHARGALRTFAIGALVPVALMAFMSVIVVAPVVVFGAGMGGIWGPYGAQPLWRTGLEDILGRSVQLVLRLLLIGGSGAFALFIRLTLMMFERRVRGADSPTTTTDAS